MQLVRLCACAIAFALANPIALAQTSDERRASASLRVYGDDDHITVVSPSVGLQVPVTESLGFDTNVTADVVSGASVDVISEASPTAIEETRLEVGAGMTWRLHRLVTMRARAIGSHERDYDSLRLNLGASVELAQRNTTVDVDYVTGPDYVGSATDPMFDDDRLSHRLMVTLTQILDRRTYVDMVAEGQYADGYHANVYRTVPIIDPLSSALMRVVEVTPRVRKGLAALARVRRAIDRRGRLALHASYRFYADDWDVTSHTGAVNAIYQAGARLKLGASLRGYVQGAADFFQSRYQLDAGVVPELRTRERRLSRMRSLFGGVTADYALTARGDAGPRVVVAASLMSFWWPDFIAQQRRSAAAFTLGVSTGL